MAGSYKMAKEAPLLLLENLGDAFEAIEEMLWLIEHGIGTDEATRLLDEEYYPMCRGEKPRDQPFINVLKIMQEE